MKRSGKIAVALCLVVLVAALAVGLFRVGTFFKKTAPVAQVSQPEASPVQETLASIVANYRKIIVLLEDDKSLDPKQAGDANTLGQSLYYRNQDLLKELGEKLSGEIGTIGSQAAFAVPPVIAHFLDELEKEPDWHDADKLVFSETLEDIVEAAAGLPEAYKKKTGLIERIEEDRKALKEIQALYDRELDKIFGRFETRGMVVHREEWEKYVTFLKTKFTREDLLKEYAKTVPKKPAAPPGKEGQTGRVSQGEFPPKSLLLTFDDGPSLRYTPRIIDILKKNGVNGVFFELGSNIGTIKADNTIKLTKASKISEAVATSGFCIGNHSYSHAFLPKLTHSELLGEIERTNRLLAAVTDEPVSLFRPPYGAQNESILQVVRDHAMRSVLWQIDSRDWADPVPKSIADRVVREVAEKGKGVILFHDINGRSVEALPLILETLKQEGYRFLSWNGKSFSEDTRGESVRSPEREPAPEIYRESWAVIIGIDRYLNWPQLHYAVNDAKGVQEILVRKYRFKPENIITLLDGEATRERILSVLGDVMGDPDKVHKDDRVFVFFAGHGMTRKLASGRDLGYIIPVDADPQNYEGKSISMTNFQDISEAIPAKHLFFVMDSCYSGLALTRGGAAPLSQNYLREVSRRAARQMLTAGGADEQVADNGPNGHSVFTWALLQGLEGQADLNNDGVITASELAAYVGPAVSAIGKQTPAFGSLVGSEGGEFIFQPKQSSEFLSELSAQLDQEAIQLNDQLAQIRKEIVEKRQRNKKLRKELALAQADAGKTGGVIDRSDRTAAFAKLMERGSALFKERKYEDALGEFLAAARMNPSSPLAANNAGYMYHKMGQYEEAIEWFQKTIALDPQRAIAYGNLGDAYLNLDRKSEARQAFLKYLELAPSSSNTPDIQGKLKQTE